MSEPMELHLSEGDDVFVRLRSLVPHSVDRPVMVFRGGKHTVTFASLYRGACLTVTEEPALRFAPFVPFPGTAVSPELAELLEDSRVARAVARLASISARKEKASA